MSKNKKRRPSDNRGKKVKPERKETVAAAAATTPAKQESDLEPAAKKQIKHNPSYFSFASFRELIESVAIAFVLAFLFRTFEAEAFVIPTGSMATTLMGRHKDVVCPQCGYPYTVSASEEVDSLTGEATYQGDVTEATCPMCRYRYRDIDREPSFSGDRILVSKFDYQLHPPERWDVTVFMYPEDAKTNFIKRLVGLPNETIRISRGDLYVKKDDETDFSIARKSPEKYLAMSRVVYDNDYAMPETLATNGWPQRWGSPDITAAWEASDDYRSFSTDGTKNKEVMLRYTHYLPDQQAWETPDLKDWRNASSFSSSTQRPAPRKIEPQLITDDCAYNSGMSKNTIRGQYTGGLGIHWVGDLGVECQLDVRRSSGIVIFELIEGGRKMLCDIDLFDGTANLTIPGETFLATAKTVIAKPGSYKVRFVNADDELRLWVNEELVKFNTATTFRPLDNQVPTEEDLGPVAIISKKADVTVSHLRVLRDIYYIAEKLDSTTLTNPMSDFDNTKAVFNCPSNLPIPEENIRHFYQSPEKWPKAFAKKAMSEVEFHLGDKQYFMLGDNSPQSKDGRLWNPQEYFVDESLLKGKAMFIYWPHSWDKVQIGDLEIPFPFFPNYERMHLVR